MNSPLAPPPGRKRPSYGLPLMGLFALILIVFTAIIIFTAMTQPQPLSSTPDSLQKLDDHPLYQMTYTGDYGFKEYLQRGQAQAPADTGGAPDWACTGFAALNPGGGPVFGRNFDWDDDPILVLFTDSPDGYATISVVDIRYLGFTNDTEITPQNRDQLNPAPYLPFDGMNERGLVVSMMAVDASLTPDPAKKTIGSLAAVRLMLDYAATVDEAVSLIGQYNIDFSGGPELHYMVADAQGRSAVIEFVDGKMNVLHSDRPYQVSTNFLLSGKDPEEARSYCDRYRTAFDRLESTGGQISPADAMDLLRQVAQPSTLWSMTYDMHSGSAELALRGNYEKTWQFHIDVKQ